LSTTLETLAYTLICLYVGRAASIANMCITPAEFAQRLGKYQEYCPVSLEVDGELVDCSGEVSLRYAAEYKSKYYKMSCQEKLEQFLANPEQFVGEIAKTRLPPMELLPKIRSADDIKQLFPQRLELKGFCPVTYVDGNKKSAIIVYSCVLGFLTGVSVLLKSDISSAEVESKKGSSTFTIPCFPFFLTHYFLIKLLQWSILMRLFY